MYVAKIKHFDRERETTVIETQDEKPMHCYLTHACLTMFYIHLYSNIPFLIDKLNSSVRPSAMERAVLLSILPDIPSDPVALLVSTVNIKSRTSSTVHKISSGSVDEGSAIKKSGSQCWLKEG